MTDPDPSTDFLSPGEIATYPIERPDPSQPPALMRMRRRMQAAGQWYPAQVAGRRWGIGCVALEITQRCNLDCTICYLSEHAEAVHDLPLAEIKRRIDRIVALYGPGTNLQITGGDPTLRHPDELAAIVRYAADRLDAVLEAIDATRFGLTLGIHSRIEGFAERVSARLRVGNAYVNRNMIGAVVGTQPFGGEGLSGTGPKAGGPRYLHRFAVERTLSVNTAAVGGNTELMSLAEE